MRAWLLGFALPIAVGACSGDPAPERHASVRAGSGAADGGEPTAYDGHDRDGDGVCDATELGIGSDPDRADSDGDGLPDFTEIISGFSATDPMLPEPDQVGFLADAAQAELEVQVRLTAEGSGQGYTGEFGSATSFDPEGRSAKDFFEGAVARGADPPDNVRGLDAASERFTSVLGKTRLSFELQFRYGLEQAASCTASYPYSYRLKEDNGRIASVRNFLLVITPTNVAGRPPFCLPASCL